MIQSFADVITIDEHTALTALALRTTFVSGRESASPRLEGTKHNEQMSRDDPAITEVAKVVGAALMRHIAFRDTLWDTTETVCSPRAGRYHAA